MFVCAHPAIDPAVRTPLMLQTVLGLDAARIAAAFLAAPSTMGQRLVRAKAKIRNTGLRFELPDAGALPERRSDVLDTVYAAFGTGWDAAAGPNDAVAGPTDEAIWLGRLLVALLPGAPQAKGLLVLMPFCDARRAARRDAAGAFVPLSRQDAPLWSHDRIIKAEGLLTDASRAGAFGRYQREAAIQSVHVQRAVTGAVNHAALSTLYMMLAAYRRTVGVLARRPQRCWNQCSRIWRWRFLTA
jgi:RNA polymerase sigma-70 factor, ECF subfamily